LKKEENQAMKKKLKEFEEIKGDELNKLLEEYKKELKRCEDNKWMLNELNKV
jgi:hypothetical protein